jgi:hypothetical protein
MVGLLPLAATTVKIIALNAGGASATGLQAGPSLPRTTICFS